MKCEDFQLNLADYLNAGLDKDEMEKHSESCAECKSLLSFAREERKTFDRSAPTQNFERNLYFQILKAQKSRGRVISFSSIAACLAAGALIGVSVAFFAFAGAPQEIKQRSPEFVMRKPDPAVDALKACVENKQLEEINRKLWKKSREGASRTRIQ